MEKEKRANGHPKMDASSSKENNTGTKPKKIPTKAQPDVAVSSPKKNLSTGAKLKKTRRTKAQADVSGSSPKKNLSTGAKLKKIRRTKAQPDVSRSSLMKNMNTGGILEKIHPILAEPDVAVASSEVNIGKEIKKIRVVTELPKEEKGLKPLKIRLVKSLSDLNLLSSKAEIQNKKSKTCV
ncbi:hypothetical protein AVEN_162373-1 [Araneus ventricosus]|uniref:Uncharacterized protein n=1 Tax=Araneus ventricosus TaxID=182803 RepID=A0A4Y2GGZ6_ARAVE|nr:hypothetical protein AVEN_162373-1 [Araneus ventricosus]